MDKQSVLKVQKLLFLLGNSPGEIDGIWGKNSEAALDATLAEYEPNVPDIAVGNTEDGFWATVKHFKREEFRCPCGKCGGFPVEPYEPLVRFLDEKRETVWAKNPITIIPLSGDPHAGGSGIRCQQYNDMLPGSVRNSKHIQGKAVDIQVKGLSPDVVKMYLDQCVRNGEIHYTYICGSSVHLDME